jgi:hypothetical protein
MDIYFVSNRSQESTDAVCTFRATGARPELWHPVTGRRRVLPEFAARAGTTSIPLRFEPYESYFIVFNRRVRTEGTAGGRNFPVYETVANLQGPWEVSFDPAWGGPEDTIFETLEDWTDSEQEGIRYYSGTATYCKSFDRPDAVPTGERIYLHLGAVHDMARIRLNGGDLGVVWCAPWQVEITGCLRDKGNQLEIEVANRWINRLIGDEQPANRDVRTVKWDSGMLKGTSYPAGRYTFTTYRCYKADDPLVPAGLLGPVRILSPCFGDE